MNWDLVRFDWSRARAFWATAETGSLSAAARALKLTQPTLSRQVEALEEELGTALFDRVGKRLVLTPAGLTLLDHVREMGQAAQKLSLAASGQAQALEGPVRITCGEAIAAYLLPPILRGLRKSHPGIEITVVATGTIQDLALREADVAIRNVRPEGETLIAQDLGARRGGFYVRRDLLADAGGPGALEMVSFEDGPAMRALLAQMGIALPEDRLRLLSEAHLVQWAWVKQGLGVGVMMTEVGDADRDLARVYPEFDVPVPMWLVAHRDVRSSRRVRAVFDAIATALGPKRAETQ